MLSRVVHPLPSAGFVRSRLRANRHPPMETITLDEAIQRALKNNPTIAQASQGILRAESLLQQARAVDACRT